MNRVTLWHRFTFLLIALHAIPAGYGLAASRPPQALGAELYPTPINEAEAILEPFWEPVLSGLKHWNIVEGTQHGLKVTQTWASVEFYWARKPEAGPALSMTRTFNVSCAGYDRLLLAAVLPEGSTVKIAAETDLGRREYVSSPAPKEIVEHALDLQGAGRIVSLTFEITAAAAGEAAGWFKWVGLQNTAMLPHYLARWDFSHKTWEGFLQDEAYEPKFAPRQGIFLTPEALEALRAAHQASLNKEGRSSYLERAPALRALQPERGITEFAWSGGRRNEQHGRTRDEARPELNGGREAAIAGLVIRDKELLRVAARYALSLAMCEKWDDGFLARFPGSAWELRSFRRSYVTEELAQLLDLAGEMFTESGRIYLMRRLAEEGIGPVNYITWRFDYLFRGNQIGFVTRGRLAACLVMERDWPHVRPYTDIACQNVQEMFGNVILSDGGALEPPSYVGSTLSRGCEMLELYARARHMDPGKVLPERLARTGDYGAVIASTLPEADVIPYGDSGLLLRSDTLLCLACAAPKSYWTTMLRKSIEREKRTQFSRDEQGMLDALPRRNPKAPGFVFLPEVGHMASMRWMKNADGNAVPVKLLILGNRAGEFHDHEHEDRGSFVLEFAGEAFAMDPGVCEYDDPLHALLKQCQYHNMLVPIGLSERPSPEQPIRAAVKPAGKGNRKSFHARMDVTPGWDAYFRKWHRSWASPAPDTIIITDDYELAKGSGVECCWQTKLPCEIAGHEVVIQGKHGRAVLEVPAGCLARIDTLPGVDGVQQHRIVFQKSETSGVLAVRVRLAAN